jgi:hypothetical protein
MVDNKLAIEEAQRAANYEAVKSNVESRVDADIAARAAGGTVSESERLENLAGNMRHKAIDEVVETDREVDRARVLARVSQVVDYIFFVIYSLLTIRLLLELFAARENAGFVKFIKAATGLFYAPFAGIMASPTTKEGFTLALPIIVAIVVYMLLHLAINRLLRLFAHRKTEI